MQVTQHAVGEAGGGGEGWLGRLGGGDMEGGGNGGSWVREEAWREDLLTNPIRSGKKFFELGKIIQDFGPKVQEKSCTEK